MSFTPDKTKWPEEQIVDALEHIIAEGVNGNGNGGDVIYSQYFEGETTTDSDESETIVASGDISTDDIYIVEFHGASSSDDLIDIRVGGVTVDSQDNRVHSITTITHDGTDWVATQSLLVDGSNIFVDSRSPANLSSAGLVVEADVSAGPGAASWFFTLTVRKLSTLGPRPANLE